MIYNKCKSKEVARKLVFNNPLLCPAHGVPRIFDLQRIHRQHQRMESIHHHRQFLRLLCPQASLDGAGMRTMRDPAGMQRDHPLGHILPAHEVPVHIIQQFVTVDIAMVIGRRNSLGMIVEQPGTKRTDYKIMPLEGLVHRRRLMYPPVNKLEIMKAEGKRVTTTLPADHVERMMP